MFDGLAGHGRPNGYREALRGSMRRVLLVILLLASACSRTDPAPMAEPPPARKARLTQGVAGPLDLDDALNDSDYDPDGGPRAPHFVVYVPTPQTVVDRMLELAKLQKDDVLYDLGCGDGRILVTAAKRYGVRAFGVDIDPRRVREARENAQASGVEDLVTVEQRDVLTVDLTPATVVTMYLLPRINALLMPQLTKLGPGVRILSHDFDLRDQASRARPDGRWLMTAPFFGRRNELYDAAAPEDSAHYPQDPHWIYLWTTPLKLEPRPAEPRDELAQAGTPYERVLPWEGLQRKLDAGRGTAADIRAFVRYCKQFRDESCAREAALYVPVPTGDR